MSKDFDMGFIAFGLTLPPDARDFFAAMTEPEWLAWQPRYRTLCSIAHGSQQILPDMTWWEKAFLRSMTNAKHIPRDEIGDLTVN
jgi:hypothetical protein